MMSVDTQLLYDLVFRDLQKQTMNLLFSSELSFGPTALQETGLLQMRRHLWQSSSVRSEAYRKYGRES